MKSIKQGDIVFHREEEVKINGIVVESRKKERSTHKSKHVIEIAVGQVADVLWDNGVMETDIRIELLGLVCRAK